MSFAQLLRSMVLSAFVTQCRQHKNVKVFHDYE